MREMKNMQTIMVVEPLGNRTLTRPRHKKYDNIKIDLRKTRLENAEWIHLALVHSLVSGLVKHQFN
jgi:hypothetical protein